MNIIDRITGKGKLKQQIEELKSSQAVTVNLNAAKETDKLNSYLQSMGYINRRPMRRPTTQKDLEASGTGFVGACVDYIADIVASRKFIVYDNDVPVDVNHWAQKWIDNPNPYYKQGELSKLLTKWRWYNGNAFEHVLTDSRGYPISSWVLPAPLVGVKVSQGGYSLIDGYTLGVYGNVQHFEPNEIIHYRNLEPSLRPEDMILGKSIIAKAIDSIGIDSEVNQFLKRYFENDTNPPLIWQTEQKLKQAEFNILRDEWNEKNPNFKLTGALPEGASVANISSDNLKIGLDVLDEKNMRSIAMIIGGGGLSADYLLFGGSSNRATMEIMQERLETDCISPYCLYVAECKTDYLRKFDSRLKVKPVPFAYQDADEVRIQEDHDLNHGITTINELRLAHGKPPVLGGDVPFVKSGFVTVDSVLNPPVQSPVTMSFKKKDFDGTEEKVLVEHWKRYDKLAMTYKDTLQGQVSDVFKDLGKEMEGKVGQVAKDFNDRAFHALVVKSSKGEGYEKAIHRITTKAVEQLFDVEHWKSELIRRTGGALDDFMTTVVENALKDVNMSYDDLSNSFDKLIQTKIELTTSKITSSVDTVKEQLQQYLKDNVNLSVEDLTKGITEKFSQYSEGGAARVAQTTSTFAKGAAKSSTWGDFGISRRWLTMRDGVVRDAHANADGQREDENGNFSVGGETMPYPAAGGDAANNVNCRCDVFPDAKAKKE